MNANHSLSSVVDLTRNSPKDLIDLEERSARSVHTFASLGVQCNGSGPISSERAKCLDMIKFREFLEDYQEMNSLEDEDIFEIIQVSYIHW